MHIKAETYLLCFLFDALEGAGGVEGESILTRSATLIQDLGGRG